MLETEDLDNYSTNVKHISLELKFPQEKAEIQSCIIILAGVPIFTRCDRVASGQGATNILLLLLQTFTDLSTTSSFFFTRNDTFYFMKPFSPFPAYNSVYNYAVLTLYSAQKITCLLSYP
jgi:hypothetical protein